MVVHVLQTFMVKLLHMWKTARFFHTVFWSSENRVSRLEVVASSSLVVLTGGASPSRIAEGFRYILFFLYHNLFLEGSS